MAGIDPGASRIEGKRAYHWATAANTWYTYTRYFVFFFPSPS